ncbi:MAG: hypothetical protein CK425_11940 [Parachlamydia sp.]|nr:MAG: hypothetical protein CK425_11940 [Parachlamydia sp.]
MVLSSKKIKKLRLLSNFPRFALEKCCLQQGDYVNLIDNMFGINIFLQKIAKSGIDLYPKRDQNVRSYVNVANKLQQDKASS